MRSCMFTVFLLVKFNAPLSRPRFLVQRAQTKYDDENHTADDATVTSTAAAPASTS